MVSGFGLGALASLVVISCVLSVRFPPTISFPLNSWFGSVSDGASHSDLQKSAGSLPGNEGEVVTEETHAGNPRKSPFTGREPGLVETHEGNLAGDVKNSSFLLNGDKILDGNSGLSDETHVGNLPKSSTGNEPNVLKSPVGNWTGLSKTHSGDQSKSSTGKDSGILVNKENSSKKTLGKLTMSSEKINERNISLSNVTSPSGVTLVVGNPHFENTSKNHINGESCEKKDEATEKDHGRVGVDGERKYGSCGSDQGRASERTQEGASESNRSGSAKTTEGFYQTCDIFNGRWVRDERKPYYPAGSCPYIDDDFDCHKNGRLEDGFLRWRWQPYDCNIPRLNVTDFLERLRNKRLIFVGDSLNRNMWESLVCILRDSVKDKHRVYEVGGRSEFKTKGYYAFRFEDYNCSVDFVRSPFLVQEVFFKNANGSEDEKLRLDLLDQTTSAYGEAEIIVFNTGHWWTHEKTSRGKDYYQEGNYVYPVLKAMEGYKRALNTWARWVDKNINSKTQVVFRGYSLTHFRGGQWNSGGQCHKETEPIFNESFLAKYPSKMRALEGVLEQMRTPVIYLNVSRLTDYRKDGHPSIYRKTYKTTEEQIAAEKSQDCSHWCLPGIPDTWNELLYASLLMNGQRSRRR